MEDQSRHHPATAMDSGFESLYYRIRTSVAQLWIRIYELSLEYWHPSMIFGIARAVGKPLKIDDRSLCGIYGHYVRVQVESGPIHAASGSSYARANGVLYFSFA